jgi:N6-adenosine-specific RNA methylase IME4
MKYQVIYADPPWQYKVYSKKGEGRSAENHYRCMNIEEIYNLPVADLADENCVLFLWVTFPLLQEGLETIKRWGFTYKTCAFNWVKRNKSGEGYFYGLGFWTRANAEVCLLATRGNPKRVSKAVPQICDSKIREHSRKPDIIRRRIVELCGDVPRVELFARGDKTKDLYDFNRFDGWDTWGNEIQSNIAL